ncbi:MAG: aminoglycoside phosphotransferase family protein [Demequina sp.]|jgi:aminoglycoside phosphotransferase (APT) family kinase protein|nr:aminoglycoside phosphotransferase family protein [Demequina sp.]
MESITKNRQSLDTLRAMVARAYGPGAVPGGDDFAEELGHGWFNVAYAITLAGGRRVVLKIAPPAGVRVMTYEHQMMRIELAALDLIRAQTAVPVPKVDFADTTGEIIEADWFFMDFIDGDNLGIESQEGRISDAERADYARQLGALNRELNRPVGPWFGPLAGPGFATWREAFLSMIEDVLKDGEALGVDLARDYAEIRAAIARDAGALDAVAEPRFIEWDLWDSNVMIRDGRIVAIIDHERAFYGDPLMEACFTALDLPAFGDATAFREGYGLGALDAPARTRRRLYTLYLVLIMIIETRYRGHTDDDAYDWARERLTEILSLLGEPAGDPA